MDFVEDLIYPDESELLALSTTAVHGSVHNYKTDVKNNHWWVVGGVVILVSSVAVYALMKANK